jgi:hypothetical protein
MEWVLDIFLIGLLAATLFHAVRLERALGVLKRDRATLEALVAGFNASTQQAEAGIERLRAATDGAGRQIARQIDTATALKDDLTFLTDRGERLADRLDGLVRAARPLAAERPRSFAGPAEPPRSFASPAEPPRSFASPAEPSRSSGVAAEFSRSPAMADAAQSELPRVRSQAERDLLRALRMAR